MSARRNASDLAALLRAMETLAPEDGTTREAICSLLGFRWRGTKARISGMKPTRTGPKAIPAENRESARASSNVRPRKLRTTLPIMLEPVSSGGGNFAVLPVAPPDVAPIPPTKVPENATKPPYENLFDPDWFRSLVSFLVSIPTESSELDWRRLHQSLQKVGVLRKLPFRLRPSFAHGVSLFVDRSLSMQPFWRDEREFAQQLQRIIGKSHIRVFTFEVDHTVPDGSGLRWRSEPPPLGIRWGAGIVLSDFGTGDPDSFGHSSDEHELVLQAVRACSGKVILLTPCPSYEWPSGLAAQADLVLPWDRKTSLVTARRCWHNRASGS